MDPKGEPEDHEAILGLCFVHRLGLGPLHYLGLQVSEGMVRIWSRAGSASLLAHGASVKVHRPHSQHPALSLWAGHQPACSGARWVRRPLQEQRTWNQTKLGCWEGSRHGGASPHVSSQPPPQKLTGSERAAGPLLVPESG